MAPLHDHLKSSSQESEPQCPAAAVDTRPCSPYFSLPSAVLLTIYSFDTVSEIFKRDLTLNRAVYSLLVDTLRIRDLILSNEHRLIPWPQRQDAIAGPDLLAYSQFCRGSREVLAEVADFSAFSSVFYNLIIEGISATSQDDPIQGISKSITNDDDFWSSSGKAYMACHQNCCDRTDIPTCICDPQCLVYGLCDRSLITKIELNFYRADYQAGRPTYAPRAVRVFVRDGPEGAWEPATGYIETINSPERFCIHLAPKIVIASSVRIELYGRQQTQQEDGQWYVCVRYARAVGVPLSSTYFGRRYPILKSLISSGSAGQHPPRHSEYDRVLMSLEYDLPAEGPWLPACRITTQTQFDVAIHMMDRALKNVCPYCMLARQALYPLVTVDQFLRASEELEGPNVTRRLSWSIAAFLFTISNPVTSVAVYRMLFEAYADLFTSDWEETERQRVRDGLRVPDPIGVVLHERFERFRVGDQRLTAFETVMLIRWVSRQADRREEFQEIVTRCTSVEERFSPCLLTVEVGDELRRFDLPRSVLLYQHSRVLPHDSFLGTFVRLGIDWPADEADPVHDLLLNLRGVNAVPLLTRFYGAQTRELAHVVSVCIAHYQALAYPSAASANTLDKPLAESGTSGKRYAQRLLSLIERLPLNPQDEGALRIQLQLRLEDTGSEPEIAIPSRYPGCPTLIALDDTVRKFGDFDEE
ncbi:hypothetical protein FOL47_010818 [Perkinsus chesapeaki]|uniref:Uncharacterized protein n=1 Tax=Perkinsus chesapeaki TaxID=330153 RepID=A0A7J6L0Z4_PERCH|nr:hypothetical protein FOL47_010818 [Perkinsus chesapeaki]